MGLQANREQRVLVNQPRLPAIGPREFGDLGVA